MSDLRTFKREDDPLWIAQQFLRQQADIGKAQSVADAAISKSEMNARDHTAHELLCSHRHLALEKTLNGFSDKFINIFMKLDKLTGIVYIGVGIWVGMPVIGGAIFGLIKLIAVLKGS